MKKIIFLILISTLSFVYSFSFSQSADELYKQGLKLKAEFKYKEGLAVFQQLLKTDSINANYLANASYFYSRSGNLLATEGEKMKYYKIAEALAKKSIKADEKNAETHYAYALALGRINENAGSSQKIANAKLIKAEADRAIQLNPKHAGAYHILGRWHREIATLSGVKKIAINSLYGGVPQGSSLEESVKCFQAAIVQEPKYMLHQYELALTYEELDKKAEAKAWVKKALECPVQTPNDPETKKKCEEMLKKMGA